LSIKVILKLCLDQILWMDAYDEPKSCSVHFIEARGYI